MNYMICLVKSWCVVSYDAWQRFYLWQDRIVILLLQKSRNFLGEWFEYMLYPNLLTSIRLAQLYWILPLVFTLTFNQEFFIQITVFFILDYLDGKSARAFNYTSDVGAFYDQLVDKMLTIPVLLMYALFINTWLIMLVIPMITVDVSLVVLRIKKHKKTKIASPSNFYGKFKMVLQSGSIYGIPFASNQLAHAMFFVVLLAALALAVKSYLDQKKY